MGGLEALMGGGNEESAPTSESLPENTSDEDILTEGEDLLGKLEGSGEEEIPEEDAVLTEGEDLLSELEGMGYQ